jgi:peroxiredoxin
MKNYKVTNRKWSLFLLAGMIGVAGVSHATDFSAQHREIISQLQVMSQGLYTDAEWNEVAGRLDNVLAQAKAEKKWDAYVETQVIRANVMSMRGDDKGALALMQSTLSEFEKKKIPSLKRVYVEIASLHARAGNQQEVTAIMNKFKASKNYDSESYAYSGGDGPKDPIVMMRPSAGADASISMTAMDVYRTQSQFAPGQNFPDFTTTGWDGNTVSLSDFQGQLLLVDFWAPGWYIWSRDLPHRRDVFDRYHGYGFQILGMTIDPDESAARSYAAANNMTWPQAVAPRELKKTLGVFGETANYLLNRDGVIIGRNLYGSDLDAAIRNNLK